MSVTFANGPTCAGGSHWITTVTIGGDAIEVPVSFDRHQEELTLAQKQKLAPLLVQDRLSTASNKGNTQSVKAKLASVIIPDLG